MKAIEDLQDLQLEPRSKTHPPGQRVLEDRLTPSAMQEFTENALEKWENEGGATWRAGSDAAAAITLTGTVNQIEWAEQIKERVGQEFDRVANAMKSVAARQVERDRTDTDAVVAILEEKRLEVMAKDRAGYFITDWQELGDQVRQMVVKDPRYGQIMADHAARKRTLKIAPG